VRVVDDRWFIPVVTIPFDNANEAEAYLVADNRMNEIGGWDPGDLAELLSDLKNENDALLEGVGFSNTELKYLFERQAQKLNARRAGDVEDVVPVGKSKIRVKRGDVWSLGRHHVVCDDSATTKFVDHDTADLVFTSPPYNVGIKYEQHHDEQSSDEYMDAVRKVAAAAVGMLRRGRACCWNVGVGTGTYPYRHAVMLEKLGLTIYRQMVWAKQGVPVPSWHITQRKAVARMLTSNFVHEMVYVMQKGTLEKGGPVDFDDMLQSDVFKVAARGVSTDPAWLPEGHAGKQTGRVSLPRRTAKNAHPAAFPPQLPAAFIQHLTEPNELVVDPFGGSGSTMIACEQMNRRCVLIDIDPAYCTVAIERWQALTGKKAKRVPPAKRKPVDRKKSKP
jgi:DNA modification methylase